MPLTLITGPAGSGKTGAVLDRFVAGLDRRPLLVVPNAADARRYEQEALERAGGLMSGGRVVTFAGLFDEVARDYGVVTRPRLEPAQRSALLSALVRGERLVALDEASAGGGFVAALDAFVDSVQSALVEPAELGRRLAGAGRSRRHLGELARLYAAYDERLAALGLADRHMRARAAIAAAAAEPSRWAGRPLLVHGFDDLAPEQLALLEALAPATELTVSAVHEPGRACLAARQRLVDQVSALGEGAGGLERRELEPPASASALRHLERQFLRELPSRAPAGDEVVRLEAAGERAEIELVGAEISELLRSGRARPDEVALIARTPEAVAGLVREVFDRWGIPVAVRSGDRFAATAAGLSLSALARAAGVGGSPADLVAYLRFPGRAAAGALDALERSVRRRAIDSVDEAASLFREQGGRELWELAAVREVADRAAPLARLLARLARELFDHPLRRSAPLLAAADRAERAVAERAAVALEQAAELWDADPGLAPGGDGVLDLLAALDAPDAAEPAAGRVELLSPYQARARQFPFVFLLSLQEGVFPRHAVEDPFLDDSDRARAGLPARADQRDEERYLFYSSLTRALSRVYLSYQPCDEDGGERVRSFFVDDVLELLDEPDSLPRRERGLADVTFAADRAPSERELLRALALRRETGVPDALGASPDLATRLAAELERARRRADYLPGSLTSPAVLEALAGRREFGASSLEEYATCPFRYFVGHELRPPELAPDPEPRTRGSLVHAVLERLYGELWIGSRPRPDDLEPALERARGLLAELAPEHGLAPTSARKLAAYRRIESDVVRFVRWDAEHPIGESVFAVEASFGEGEGDDREALQLDGFALHGKIDRIDLLANGRALVRDYKASSRVSPLQEMRDRGRLQLQLYLLAVERLWQIRAGGGLYHALGSQNPASRSTRGCLPGPAGAAPFDDGALVKTDFTGSDEDFRDLLDSAGEDAARIAAAIQGGELRRAPIGGTCPRWCDFHTICRMERGAKNPPEDAPAREADEDD